MIYSSTLHAKESSEHARVQFVSFHFAQLVLVDSSVRSSCSQEVEEKMKETSPLDGESTFIAKCHSRFRNYILNQQSITGQIEKKCLTLVF